MPLGGGASEMPQLPPITVVTPWLTLGSMSGCESIRRSSCVCASMKPGATILPPASSSSFALPFSFPIAAILPPLTARSASKRSARVPSMTVPLRISRSQCSGNLGPRLPHPLGPLGRFPAHQLEERLGAAGIGLGVELPIALDDGGSGERAPDFRHHSLHDFFR